MTFQKPTSSATMLMLSAMLTLPSEAFQSGQIFRGHAGLASMVMNKNSDTSNEDSSFSTPYSQTSQRRRSVVGTLGAAGGGIFGGLFNGNDANASSSTGGGSYKSSGPTNEVVKVKNGIKHRRLGGSDIVVSELGLGTQVCMPLSAR